MKRRRIGIIFMFLLVWFSLCFSTTVQADDLFWNVSNGNWSNSSNWVNGTCVANCSGNPSDPPPIYGPNRVPTGTDHALLHTNNADRTVYYNSTNPAFELLNLGAPSGTPDSPYSGKVTLNLTGGTLQTTGPQDTIGGTGKGAVIQTGGSYITGSLVIGSESTGIGTYNLSGTGSISTAAFEMVGASGTGTFTQSAGSHSVGTNLYLGASSGSNGTFSLSGTGNLDVLGSEAVGYNGTGTFNQSSGINNVGKNLIISRFPPGSSGTYNLTGGTLNVNGDIVNSGTFIQSNETSNTSNNVKGMFTQAANYTLSNGTLTASGGFSNTGTFNQTGGINTSAIGTTATIGSSGTYNLGGGTLNTNGGLTNNGTVNMTIGNTTGQLVLGNGTNMTNNNTFNIIGQGNVGGVSNFGWSSLSNSIQNGPSSIIIQPVSYLAPADPATPVTGNITNSATGTWTASQTYAIYGAVATNTTPTATPQCSLDYTLKTIFYNDGAYISDPSTSIFFNLINGGTGYLQGGMGDEFLILGDFENNSTQTSLWDTDEALLGFVGDNGSTHNYLLSGSSPEFDWGALYLAAGNSLSIDGSTHGLYFENIFLERDINQLLQITSNTDIYYSKLYISGAEYSSPIGLDISGEGRLIHGNSVPEPATLLLLGLGLIGLVGVRRKM